MLPRPELRAHCRTQIQAATSSGWESCRTLSLFGNGSAEHGAQDDLKEVLKTYSSIFPLIVMLADPWFILIAFLE